MTIGKMIAMRNYLLNNGYTERGYSYICMLINSFWSFSLNNMAHSHHTMVTVIT